MTNDPHHQRVDAARVRAELSVQDLWLRYLGLGGSRDAFDIDGYLQGVLPLQPLEREVLAQAVNEALREDYDSYCVAPATPVAADSNREARLRALTAELLDRPFRPDDE